MARKISEIYDRLNVAKSTFQELHDFVVDADNSYSVQDNWETLLSNITSGSKVAAWRLFMWIFSAGSWIVETLLDKHKVEITEILAAKQPHHLRWYAEESKKFQFGHALVWSNNQYSYARVDEDARIVKYAAASEKNGKVILKVAKETSGVKSALSVLEKATFTEFWRQWKDAGVKLEIVSQPADLLKINVQIVRDRLVLASNNSLLTDSSVFPIQDAIKKYASSLEFDGVIMLSKLVDAIQAVEGVIDVKLNSAYHKPNGGSYTLVPMSVESVSGYFVIASDSSYTYTDNVTVEIQD